MGHELKNDRISLHWNDAGELDGMVNLKTGREQVNAHALCRLVLGCPELLEFEAIPAGLNQVEKRTGTLVFHYGKVVGENGNEYAVGVELQITLCGEDIQWGIAIRNGTDSVTVRESHYPVFSIREPGPPLKVHTSELVSTTYPELPSMLRSRFTHYMAPDQKYIRHTSFYPGRTSSMGATSQKREFRWFPGCRFTKL